MRVLQIVFLVMLVPLVAPQQPLSASLEGMVVSAGTGEGVSRARVELLVGTTISLTTMTDAEGRFFFPNVQPGPYRLVSSRAGYVDAEYGQRRRPAIHVSAMSSHQPAWLTLTGGQRMQGIRLGMARGSVISGRVVVSGKPVGNVDVKALVSSHELGMRVLTSVLSSRTNDLGEYRIFWLPPGQYYVVADVLELQAAANSQTVMTGLDPSSNPLFLTSMPLRFAISRAIGAGGNDATMFVSMYPPGVPDWRNSTPIALVEGSQVSGVDIQLNPVPSLHVRGSITGIPPNPGGQITRPSLSLVPLNAGVGLLDAGIALTVAPIAGTFEFSRVSPGAYVLTASAGNLIGRVALDVRDRDINSLIVPLVPGVTVPGRVMIEGAASSDPDARLDRTSNQPA